MTEIKKMSRRDFLKLIGDSALVFGGSLLLVGCESGASEDDKNKKIEETKKHFKDEAGEEGMMFKESKRLSSGLLVNYYTDNNALEINWEEFEKAFTAPFLVIDSISSPDHKEALIKTQQTAKESRFQDREFYLLVASNPQTYIDMNDHIFRKGSNSSAAKRPITQGDTASMFLVDRTTKKNIGGARIIRTKLAAGANANYQVVLNPAGELFMLEPAEGISSALSHEAFHIYLRLMGFPQQQNEEIMAQHVEKNLLLRWKKLPAQRPLPFKF